MEENVVPILGMLIKNNWKSFKGFLLGLLLIILLYTIFIYILNSISPLNFTLFNFNFYLSIILLIYLIIWLVYKIKSLIIPVKAHKLNVALSFKVDEDAKVSYEKTIQKFRDKISSIDQLKSFNIFELDPKKRSENTLVNEKLIQDEDINLLVWGNVDIGNVNGQETTIFKINFSFNFILQSKSKDQFDYQREIFNRSITENIGNRNWKIEKSQSLPHLYIVSDNLTEVVLYIIIRCLITFGFIKIAYLYSDQLLKSLEMKDPKNFPYLEKFVYEVKKLIIHEALTLVDFYSLKDIKEREKYALIALKYDEKSYSALTNLAVIYWLKNDKNKSIKYAARAKKIMPSTNTNRFNDAFFALDRSDYSKALSMYKKINSVAKDSNVISTIEMIENEYDKTKNPAYLFAAGLVNIKFADKQRGEGLVNQFIKEAKDNKSFDELIEYSKSLLQ